MSGDSKFNIRDPYPKRSMKNALIDTLSFAHRQGLQIYEMTLAKESFEDLKMELHDQCIYALTSDIPTDAIKFCGPTNHVLISSV